MPWVSNQPIPLCTGRKQEYSMESPVEGRACPLLSYGKTKSFCFQLSTLEKLILSTSTRRSAKRVFGITHPNTEHVFIVLCLDRKTGKTLWRREATRKIPHEGTHGDNNFASASPTTDGQRLYCWFGSAGLFCYDLDGKKLWERDLGRSRLVQVLVRVVLLFCTRINLLLFVIVRGNRAYRS